MKPYRKYDDLLQEQLQEDPRRVTGYLREGIRDYEDSGESKVLCGVLRDIIKARGGMTKLSRKIGIKIPNLYSLLSGKSNLQFISLCKIVNALGLTFNVEKKTRIQEPKKTVKKRAKKTA